jgi:hypothetical protein
VVSPPDVHPKNILEQIYLLSEINPWTLALMNNKEVNHCTLGIMISLLRRVGNTSVVWSQIAVFRSESEVKT